MNKKNAWPWIGTTEHEMGSMAPKGEVTDKEEYSHQQLDSLTPEKSVVENQEPGVRYEGGIISPVDGVSFSDDTLNPIKRNKDYTSTSVDILGEDDELIASFSCNIAESMQDKIMGLQGVDGLSENAGLIFKYSSPEDVVYHMGTVSFPIDIIFIDSNNRIKKLYRNIQPGTLGTFGCAGVSNVLEITGGLSDRLGVSVGNFVSINSNNHHLDKLSSKLGSDRNIIIKYSNLEKPGFSSWNDYPIFTIGDSLTKTAQINAVSSFASNFSFYSDKTIYAFDFDGLIESSPNIRVYKTSEVVDEKIPYIKINGHTASIDTDSNGNELYRDIHIADLNKNAMYSNESIISSLNKSYYNFINSLDIAEEAFKMFENIRTASQDLDSDVVIVTRFKNSEYVRDVICNRISLQFGEPILASVLQLEEDADAINIVDAIRRKYGNKDIKIFSDSNLLKRAGSPIPDDVKATAKKIYALLDKAESLSEKSLENMLQNKKEYERISADPEKIKNSQGQYNQSVRRNTRIIRELLLKIRDSIALFSKIKDISTTAEVIDSLATSSKQIAKAIEKIFDLIEQIDSPDFYMMLSQEVDAYERVIGDFKSSIEKGKDYINSDILGLLILSE